MIGHWRMAQALALAAALLAVGTIHASPPFPFTVYGTVKVNGANVPAGTVVTAWCGELQAGSAPAEIYEGQSVYNLNVNGDDPATPEAKEGCAADEVVRFKIGDLDADQTANWQAEAFLELNLTAGGGSLRRVYLPLLLH